MDILKRNNVHISGEGESTILYAHGFGCHQGMWDLITPHFQKSHRQILFDYVGSGQSDLSAFDPKRYAALQGYRDDVLEICDALELTENIIFVGHSVSCSIGWLASIARPNLFSKQISVGPTPCFLNLANENYNGGFNRQDLEELLTLMDQNYIGWAEYLAPVITGGEMSEPVTGKLADSFCSTDPMVAKMFARATFFSDNRSELASVTTPNLLLHHGQDALVPGVVAEYLNQALKKSTLKILNVSGHCSHMSHPDVVVEMMREYIYSNH